MKTSTRSCLGCYRSTSTRSGNCYYLFCDDHSWRRAPNVADGNRGSSVTPVPGSGATAASVRLGRMWSPCRCHIVPSSRRTLTDEALVAEVTCPGTHGEPGRKFLANTGVPGFGKGSGRHPLSKLRFCFNCFCSAVFRRFGCGTSNGVFSIRPIRSSHRARPVNSCGVVL